MKILLPLVVGILGFLILYGVDYFDLKKKRLLKFFTWILGIMLLLISHLQIVLTSKIIIFPEFLKSIGIVLSVIFFILLLYSVFIEISVLGRKGCAVSSSGLIRSGTYALSRHPGVLWYIMTLIFLFIATGAKYLLYAIPVWSIMDILYAILQDLYFFPRLFGEEYDDYKKSTPMILPSFKSIRSCILSYRKILLIDEDQTA